MLEKAATGGAVHIIKEGKGEVRLDDNEIRISGARRADVTCLGEREHHVEGLALPESLESGTLSVNEAGIRWMSL